MCVCSLRYPACSAHAPRCHLWSAQLYDIFQHYLIIGTIFGGGRILEHKMGAFFSTSFARNISHFKKNWATYDVNCTLNRLFLSDFHGIWVFSENFRKILKYQISRKFVKREPSFCYADGRAGAHADRHTDRHDKANSHFHNFSNTPTNRTYINTARSVDFSHRP